MRNETPDETFDHDKSISSSLIHYRGKMNARDKLWNLRFQQLAEYKQTHADNCILPPVYAPIPELSGWVANQRRSKREKKISVEREKRLNAIGFTWSVRSEKAEFCTAGTTHTDWDIRFQQLKEYKKANGDLNVSRSKNSQYKDLGRWNAAQRCSQRKCRLRIEREAKLNSIGFVWTKQEHVANAYSESWALRFQELLKYKKEFGDCNVPSNFICNQQLGQWVRNQRWYVNNKMLTKERLSQLNSIGFDSGRQGNVRERWALRFRQLLEYKKEFGDCNVPENFSGNLQLGQWVHSQRWPGNTKVTEGRLSQLNSIGFDSGQQREIGRAATTTTTTTRTTNDPVILLRETRVAELSSEVFETQEKQWDTRFRELLACFQAHGDFNVHQYYPRNLLLTEWVSEQRNDYDLQGRGKQTSLTSLREAKLDAIGFAWFVDGDGISSTSSSRDAPCGIY
jgi:hypothetical protein